MSKKVNGETKNISNSNQSSTNYYEQEEYDALEKFVVAEDITFSKITNVTGKFYYNAMTLNDSKDEPKDTNKGSYSTSNYVELVIPTHLLFAFVEPSFKRLQMMDKKFYNVFVADSTSFTIPKGTVFVGEMLGGTMQLDKIVLIGLYI